jgi:hypothetical protein
MKPWAYPETTPVLGNFGVRHDPHSMRYPDGAWLVVDSGGTHYGGEFKTRQAAEKAAVKAAGIDAAEIGVEVGRTGMGLPWARLGDWCLMVLADGTLSKHFKSGDLWVLGKGDEMPADVLAKLKAVLGV